MFPEGHVSVEVELRILARSHVVVLERGPGSGRVPSVRSRRQPAPSLHLAQHPRLRRAAFHHPCRSAPHLLGRGRRKEDPTVTEEPRLPPSLAHWLANKCIKIQIRTRTNAWCAFPVVAQGQELIFFSLSACSFIFCVSRM